MDEATGNAMLLIYNDWIEKVQFWTPYMLYGSEHSSAVPAEFMVTEKLITTINIHLAKIFDLDVDQVPMPKASAAHAWYDQPYFAGAHLISPGFHYPTVMKMMLKPVKDKGKISSNRNVLVNIFNLALQRS